MVADSSIVINPWQFLDNQDPQTDRLQIIIRDIYKYILLFSVILLTEQNCECMTGFYQIMQ